MKNPFETHEIKKKIENPFSTQESQISNPFNSIEVSDSNITFISVVKNLRKLNNGVINIYANSLEEIGKSLNDTNSTEVKNILQKISTTNDYDKINEYILQLEEIAEKYEAKKEKVVVEASDEGKGLSKEVQNAPEIKDPLEFIKSLLEANQSLLDGSITKVETLMNEATNLSEDELFKKLSGNPLETTWNILDVEPEEWDLYFEEHNIPKGKQNQLKKYFSKLIEHKDFGNTLTNKFSNDFGTQISSEAERIMSLGNNEKIIIKLDELNPSTGPLEFKDKKSALLYIYYNKILLREVATFLEDIIVGIKNIGGAISWLAEGAYENFAELIILAIGYMGVNTIGSVGKKINASIINSHIPIIRHLSIGEYLEESDAFIEGGSDTKEAVQLKKRKEVIKKLKDYYESKGDENNLKIVEDAEKYINVLDHKLDSSSEKTKFGEKFRFSEGIFWRKLAQLKGEGAINKNKWVDRLFKPYLLSTRGKVITFVENIKRKDSIFKGWVNNELINESGENKSFLREVENFIKKSHEIPNNLENEILEEFNKIVEELKKGNYGEYSSVKNKTEFLKKVKSNILSSLNSKFDGLNLTDKIFKEGNKLNNAKDLFFDGFDDFEPERGTNKMNKWVENLFEGDSITDNQLTEIKKFFAEIQKGTNEYNQKTSLDILARIIKEDLDYKTAIDNSFKVKWEHIKKINVDSDLKGSLDNLLTKINNGEYSLAIDDSTKRNDVNKIITSSDYISDDLEEKGSKERNKRAKELKKERQKRDKLKIKEDKLNLKEHKKEVKKRGLNIKEIRERKIEKIKIDLKDLEKLKNIYNTEFKNNKISITFLGFSDSINNKNITRQVIILNKNTFINAKSILEEMGNKDKLILSDKAKGIKSLLELGGVEIRDIKNNLLLNSKEYLSKKYKNTIEKIKDFPIKEKFNYLKNKFEGVEKIPKYFIEKYEKVGELINYYKYKNIFNHLQLELISRGNFKEADEIYKKLKEINDSSDKLKELLDENKDVLNLKKFYSDKYLSGENFRKIYELKKLIKELKTINFNTISESEFKTKIKQTFNIDADFGIKSFGDIKKIFKRFL